MTDIKPVCPCTLCGVTVRRLKKHMRTAHTKEEYDQAVHTTASRNGRTRTVKPHSVRPVQGGLPDTKRSKH